MDILCPVCAEPWDSYELHEEAEFRGVSYTTIYRKFKREGCAVFGERHSSNKAPAEIAELYNLMGDDVDGAIGLLDDFGFTG